MTIIKLLAASALFAAAPAVAAPTMTLPGSTAVTIPATGSANASGPISFGPGVVFTSTAQSAFGWSKDYGFAPNGTWSGSPMIGLNAATGSFTLTFATSIKGFLAETNWTNDQTSLEGIVEAFDAAGTLLESITLEHGMNLVDPGMLGFSRSSADIKSIRFSNEYVGIRSISISAAAVPEPATWAMMLLGFGMMGAAIRYRRSSSSVSFA